MAIVRETNGDAAAGADTRYTLSLDDLFRGTLSPGGDEDWIKVELSAGTVYLITLDSDEAIAGENPFQLELFDSGGDRIVRIYQSNPTAVYSSIVFEPKVTGSYYINAGSVDDGYSGSYEIVLAENTIPEGTYDEIADYLAGSDTSYAFDVGPGDTLTANVNALTDDGQRLAVWALETWTNVTGIHFRLVTGEADITFTSDESTPYAYGRADAVSPQGFALSATVNIQPWFIEEQGNTMVSQPSGLGVFIHEIGHALGLGHAGPYGSGRSMFGIDNIFLNDSYQLTVMSYFNQFWNTYIDADRALRVTPMIVDIIAIQDLYGVPDSINTGDTIYGYQSNLDGYLGEFFRLWTGETNPLFHTGVERYSAPAFADLDGDGDPDAVIGDSEGAIAFFENTGAMTAPDFTERAGADNPFQGVDAGGGFSKPVFVDLDGDGDLDVAVGTRRGDLMYLENAGTQSRPRFIEHSGAANPLNGINTIAAFSAPAFADLDNDGDPDMVVGDSDGDVHYFENIGTQANPRFIEHTGAANPLHGANVGDRVIPSFVDLDNDGDADLIIANTQGTHYYFENTGESDTPVFIERAGVDNPLNGLRGGYDGAPAFVDLDDDGDPDLVLGNRSGNLSYFENAGTPAAPDFISTNFTDPIALTLYDNGGIDTLDLRTDKDDQRVDLRPEGISDVYGLRGNLIIARDTIIENFVAGSGDDIVGGNAAANHLQGRDGNDGLWGSSGDDVLEGGRGNDRLNGGPGADTFVFASGHGNDTITDFQSGTDRIDLTDFIRLRSIDDVGITRNEADTLIDLSGYQGGTIKLAGFTGTLTASDFRLPVLIEGTPADDTLTGGPGNEVLEGGAGADRLDGGPGNDTASYRGSDTGVTVLLRSGQGERGDAQGDTLTGIEHLIGSEHGDILRGNNGNNQLDGGDGNDDLYGSGGDDVLLGGAGDDRLYAGIGDDRLEGGSGNDSLSGDGGNDALSGGAGADRLDGGNGIDWIEYGSSDAGVTVNLRDGTGEGGHAEGDIIADVENIRGSDHGDRLSGDDGFNHLVGGGGNDVLEGGAGADQLNGGAGVDAVSYQDSDAGITVNLAGGTGEGGHAEGDVMTGIENVIGSGYDDRITGDGTANQLEGGDGDDQLRGGGGADRLNGGDGRDWVIYGGSDTGVTVNLEEGWGEGGDAEGDVIMDIEHVGGTSYNDVLIGDNVRNVLIGQDGNDELRGNGGNDWLRGRAGADTLDGGPGNDTASYSGSPAGVLVRLHDASAVRFGYAEGDTLTSIEHLTGSNYNDTLAGDGADNILDGRGGDDVLYGGPAGGDDRMYGGNGDDRVFGGWGDDTLTGGAGNDVLKGGPGADTIIVDGDEMDVLFGGSDRDTFRFFPSDLGGGTIRDFTDGEDIIDLTQFTGIDSIDDLDIVSHGDNVRIRLSGTDYSTTIILSDFDMSNLDNSDFLF